MFGGSKVTAVISGETDALHEATDNRYMWQDRKIGLSESVKLEELGDYLRLAADTNKNTNLGHSKFSVSPKDG
jgi:hypothetical protein